MKQTLWLLMLLPAMTFAQQTEKKSLNGLKIRFTCLQLDKCTEVYGPGNWTLDVTNNSVQDNSSAPTELNVQKHDYTIAENVQISARNFPLLKADEMIYDNATCKAKLTGHVTLVENGSERELAEAATIDISKDTYKIVSLQ